MLSKFKERQYKEDWLCKAVKKVDLKSQDVLVNSKKYISKTNSDLIFVLHIPVMRSPLNGVRTQVQFIYKCDPKYKHNSRLGMKQTWHGMNRLDWTLRQQVTTSIHDKRQRQ